MNFRLLALRFRFSAQGHLRFPTGASNSVRGGLGAALRRVCCAPACPGPGDCPAPCSYKSLFEPRANAAGPSGLADWPRPFVLRTAHLNGATIAPGAAFHIGLNLFDLRPEALAAFEAAFAQLGRDGLGPNRTPAALNGVEGAAEPVELFLSPSVDSVSRIRVNFLTPTELKGAGSTLKSEGAILPPFELLAGRIRDRLSTLAALYGDGPLPIDFRGFAGRAARVRTVGGALREVASGRRSRRTGQTHSLGGFVGQVEYEGELTEFLPYLEAAAFTGVGRQTVWGKGEIRVEGVD